MAQKVINFDYYQLLAGKDGDLDVGHALSVHKKCKPIKLNDGLILNDSKFSMHGYLIMGTLIKNQMMDLPAMFDNNKEAMFPLDLTKDEGLAHPTSFIFDSEYGVLMYESVHGGVSLNNFCLFIEHNYKIPYIETRILLNPEEMKRFNRLEVISKIEVKVARTKNGTIFKDKNMSMAAALEAADAAGAASMTYTLSAGRSKSLKDQSVSEIVRKLKNYISGPGEGPSEVKKLVVTGREDGEEKINIDFIKNKFRSSITIEKRRQYAQSDIVEKLRLMESEYHRQRPAIRQLLD